MDLESVADELYSLPREEFTAARNTAAKRAGELGDRELAKQIGALRARLEAADQAEHEVRRRAQSAQREFDAADRAAREAQQRVHDLEHRLATPSPTSAGEDRQK